MKRLQPNSVIYVAVVVSMAVTAYNAAFQSVRSSRDLLNVAVDPEPGILALVYLASLVVTFILLISFLRHLRKTSIDAARKIARGILPMLGIGFLLCISLNGISYMLVFYLFEFVCLIAFQLFNDPNLDRTRRFDKIRLLRIGREVRGEDPGPDEGRRKGYIPLNFFNMFWIFVVACIVGYLVETVYWPIGHGYWENRAGLLWGPFSLIYGMGGLFMTVALNRFWNKNAFVVMLVAALIGGAFEYFASWYMEVTFGVLAWDYSGNFLNIDGRIDLAHTIAWGVMGLVWLRVILPTLMRVVDVTPLRWRATVTVLAVAFILTDACMTGLALDCWSQRMSGLPVVTDLQQYFAVHYDDAFMADRFESMTITEQSAYHAQR